MGVAYYCLNQSQAYISSLQPLIMGQYRWWPWFIKRADILNFYEISLLSTNCWQTMWHEKLLKRHVNHVIFRVYIPLLRTAICKSQRSVPVILLISHRHPPFLKLPGRQEQLISWCRFTTKESVFFGKTKK